MVDRQRERGPEHWDERYAAHAQGVHDGRGHHAHGPSPELVATLQGVDPGQALDLGAGSGRHALWLAEQGWQVTAVDFSVRGIDLGRAAADAAGPEVSDRVDWVVADATTWAPSPGTAYDLVFLTYFHVDADVVRRLGTWLAPGGRLVVIGHGLRNLTDGVGGPRDPSILNTPESLRDRAAGLDVERCEEVVRHDEHGDQIDVVLVARAPQRWPAQD